MSVRTEIRLENEPIASSLSGSLKVTGTDTDRSATHDMNVSGLSSVPLRLGSFYKC